MKNSLSPASSTLNKIATVKTIYELRTSEVQHSELRGDYDCQSRSSQPEIKFVAGNSERPDLLVAYTDYFIWVLKRTDTWLDSSEGNFGPSFKPSFYDNSETESVPLNYDVLAASATYDSRITSVLVCGVDKTLAPTSSSSNALNPCTFNSSWTCVVVAYESGKVEFFTETLAQLCEIHWSDCAIKQMNICMVPSKMSGNGNSQTEKAEGRGGFDESLTLHFVLLSESSVMYLVSYARLCNFITESKLYKAKVGLI